MSDEEYPTRLRWDGRRGLAKLHGRSVVLYVAPDLGAGPVWAMDYVPSDGIAEVAPRSIDARRAMLPLEIAAADSMLRALFPPLG